MSIREMASPNFQLKILSVLLASLLWLFVTLETNVEADIRLEITFANLPAGLIVKKVEPQKSSIHATGPRILLLRQRLKGASAMLDLSAFKEGTYTFAGYENAAIPVSGVKFIRVSPLTVNIQPDPAATTINRQD